MPEFLYQINPDRNVPWNNLPLLPIRKELYQTIELLEKLGDAKAALARLQGRSVVIPDQGLLINTISLQEAKISSAIENIFTTDDELYKAYSDQNAITTGQLWTKALTNYINEFGVWGVYDYKTVEEWLSFSDPSTYITKVSDKPNIPDKPTGPTSGEIEIEYTYTSLTPDPDDDLIKYCFDWDDGSVTWTDWLESGENASINHTWEKPGVYKIKTK